YISGDLYFGGRQIQSNGSLIAVDRLRSVRWSSASLIDKKSYRPYGGPAAGDSFATYQRDFNGLDYADQHYYASASGRFLTVDPYDRSSKPADPGSWNRYSYVQGDPVNASDPSDLCSVEVMANSIRLFRRSATPISEQAQDTSGDCLKSAN